MKKTNLLLLVCILSLQAYSQTSTQRVYIKGGSNARENFMKEIYQFPAFEPGLVEYKNGKQYKSVLNYNKVLAGIEFIDEKGDTLALTDESSVNKVVIGSVTYLYNPSCMQVVKDDGTLKLLKAEKLRMADTQKTGGYGIPNSTGTIQSIDRVDTRLNYNQIEINESLLLNKTTNFFIQYEQKNLVPASRKNILSMFPKQEEAIREFIKMKKTDFSTEEHLIELTAYLSSL